MHGAAAKGGDRAEYHLPPEVRLHVYHEDASNEAHGERDRVRERHNAQVPGDPPGGYFHGPHPCGDSSY